MNFIKHRNDRIIVQGEKINICKHINTIQTTLRVSHEENLIKDISFKEIEIYQEINLEVENNFIKQKIRTPNRKIKKKYGTIRENPIKNNDRVNIICKLEIINPDLRITCSIIKATSYEQKEFEEHIKELKLISKPQSPHRTRSFIVNKHSEITKEKVEWF